MRTQSVFTLRNVRSFAYQHDDLPAFHAAYLVLTFLAAALFNLGFFALLVVLHMALDVYKYRDVHRLSWAKTVEGVIRESLIDTSLLLMGLAVTVYLHPSLALYTGIKGMMLAEITLIRAVGVLAPKLKILYDFLHIVAQLDHYLHRKHPQLNKPASVVEYVALFGMFISLGLLFIAPAALGMHADQYIGILLQEMIPWTH